MNYHTSVFTIGNLAKSAGVTTPTIRFYEEIGLIPKARRSQCGQRYYEDEDVFRVTFIKQCRDFGFSIDQIRVLLELSVRSDRNCIETRDIAQGHLDEVRQKMEELRKLEARLETFVKRCEEACAGGPGDECIIFKDLAGQTTRSCCG
ncbi:helix-turn-helix domain-containing protein [Agrobacterium rhizogenes]|uniref:MerR family transcriptional regulator n=1 Tax=Rhizobium rhizogenes TaxID=359 RepID=UPI001572FF39|nr:helix-turn-helix domain-containing protein [Rhizobium rhizogenes]NTH24972.1 helix-turn-helix domain-containing protein [Rhizobium rhizogenes]